jgi:hypothetical protein
MKHVHFSKVNTYFNRPDLIRFLGGRRHRTFSHSVRKKIDKLEVKLKDIINPRLSYRIGKVESTNNETFHVEGGVSFTSSKFAKIMRDCSEIIFFIATIGNGIEEEVARFTEENYLSKAYILDSMGSVTIENMVEEFYQDMSERYRSQGREITFRFSPGYCDWSIKDQKKLFSFFDSLPTGVELMDSCLMQPRKSISGIIGVLPPDMDFAATPYNPCSECGKKDCIGRRK